MTVGSPIPGAPVSPNGQWHAPRDGGARLHLGLDLAAPAGAIVRAPVAGRVVVSQPVTGKPWTGHGPELVVLRAGNGWRHLVSHLGARQVEVGEDVSTGQALGTVSGLRHTHWQVYTPAKRKVNPVAWLQVQGAPLPKGARAPSATEVAEVEGAPDGGGEALAKGRQGAPAGAPRVAALPWGALGLAGAIWLWARRSNA